MDGVDPVTATKVFFVIFAGLTVGVAIFTYTAPIPLRRRLLAPISIGAGVLLVLFAALTKGVGAALFAAVGTAVVVALNLRITRICGNCGRTNFKHDIFGSPQFTYCRKCGKPLELN